MLSKRIVVALTTSAAVLSLLACSTVGGMMQSVGGGLTDYSKKEDGFLNKAAGVAGGVYTSVGTAIKADPTSTAVQVPEGTASAPSQKQ